MKILKSSLSFLLVLIFALGIGSTSASAATQSPTATVYLGSFDLQQTQTYYSNFCKATLTEMTLIVSSNDDVNYIIQERKAGFTTWTNKSTASPILANNTKYIRFSSTKNNDYRLQLTAPIFNSPQGTVNCE